MASTMDVYSIFRTLTHPMFVLHFWNFTTTHEYEHISTWRVYVSLKYLKIKYRVVTMVSLWTSLLDSLDILLVVQLSRVR